MNYQWVGVPCAALACFVHPADAMAAETKTPEWVYGAVLQLAEDAKLDIQEAELRKCTRTELAALVSEALKQVDASSSNPLVEEYVYLSQLLVADEVQWKLAKEQEDAAQAVYQKESKTALKRLEGNASYGDTDGKRLPIENVQERLQSSARDFAQAKIRSKKKEFFANAVKERRNDLQAQLSGCAVKTETEAEKKALEQCRKAEGNAFAELEKLVRASMQGENRVDEVMKIRKQNVTKAQAAYECAVRDYAFEMLPNEQAAEPYSKDSLNCATKLKAEFFSELQAGGTLLPGRQEIPSWCDDALMSLVKCGYLPYPAKNLKACSRMEYAEIVASALKKIEQVQMNVLPDEFARMQLLEASVSQTEKAQQAAKKDELFSVMTEAPFHEMAGKTEEKYPASVFVSYASMQQAAKLRAEFMDELAASGYLDDEAAESQLYANVPVHDVVENRFQIDGEVRLDSGYSSGEEGVGNRTRLRIRLYPSYAIDKNWRIIGMAEYQKILSGPESSDDNKVKLDRYYVEGKTLGGTARLGAHGANFAEGNVYDTKFKGASYEGGKPVKYKAYVGSIDKAKRVAAVEAEYKAENYDVSAGIYHFDKINNSKRDIYMLNFATYLGPVKFGAMYLHGQDASAGNGNGFVLTARYGDAKTWKRGTSAYWIKYYRQPSSTYVEHTMNGMADYMSYDHGIGRGGFRGFGIGTEYVIAPDLLFSLEYYDLVDLATRERCQTIWGAFTGYFSTAKEL